MILATDSAFKKMLLKSKEVEWWLADGKCSGGGRLLVDELNDCQLSFSL